MDRNSIYKRLLDVYIQVNQLLSDIKESDYPYPSGGCMMPLQLVQERGHAELERQHRDSEERHCRDIQERQKQRDNGNFFDIHEYDEIDGRSQNEGSSGRV